MYCEISRIVYTTTSGVWRLCTLLFDTNFNSFHIICTICFLSHSELFIVQSSCLVFCLAMISLVSHDFFFRCRAGRYFDALDIFNDIHFSEVFSLVHIYGGNSTVAEHVGLVISMERALRRAAPLIGESFLSLTTTLSRVKWSSLAGGRPLVAPIICGHTSARASNSASLIRNRVFIGLRRHYVPYLP